MEKTKQKEQEGFSTGSIQDKSTNSYMNFLEKQIDKANRSFQEMGLIQANMSELNSKVALLELG